MKNKTILCLRSLTRVINPVRRAGNALQLYALLLMTNPCPAFPWASVMQISQYFVYTNADRRDNKLRKLQSLTILFSIYVTM